MVLRFIRNQKRLLRYILLSYLDKGIIFLVPLIVLNLFLSKEEYIVVEYIYSFSIIIIPFLDLGINGYIFYGYRERNYSKRVLVDLIKVFEKLFIVLSILGLLLILFNRTVFLIDDYLELIIIRSLYVMSFGFITSLFRLLNTPEKSLYISLIFSSITISGLLICYFTNIDFDINYVFLGQIMFVIALFVRVLIKQKSVNINIGFVWSYIKKSLLYSWPSILQVFVLMYIANYGKLNILKKLSTEEGVILSISQRYAFLIQIMHTSILAFVIKKIFEEETLSINKKTFLTYSILIVLSSLAVFVLINANILYSFPELSLMKYLKIILLIIFYTLIWCLYSYFEIFFSRENKNIIKLYLALIGALAFFVIVKVLNIGFLEKLTIAMAFSITVSFITSLIILKKRGYKLL